MRLLAGAPTDLDESAPDDSEHIWHLIEAIVSGSHLYNFKIAIAPFAAPSWTTLKQRYTDKIGAMLELLQGRPSGEMMAVVTDRKNGLFLQPGEIKYK